MFTYTDAVFKVRNWSNGLFTYNEKLVLLVLAERADVAGFCFPGYTKLQEDTGLSRGRISEAVNSLEKLKLITIKTGARGSFKYYLHLEAIQAFAELTVETTGEATVHHVNGAESCPNFMENYTDLTENYTSGLPVVVTATTLECAGKTPDGNGGATVKQNEAKLKQKTSSTVHGEMVKSLIQEPDECGNPSLNPSFNPPSNPSSVQTDRQRQPCHAVFFEEETRCSAE
jgi:DNA-binding MarR family transcriptional regulator